MPNTIYICVPNNPRGELVVDGFTDCVFYSDAYSGSLARAIFDDTQEFSFNPRPPTENAFVSASANWDFSASGSSEWTGLGDFGGSSVWTFYTSYGEEFAQALPAVVSGFSSSLSNAITSASVPITGSDPFYFSIDFRAWNGRGIAYRNDPPPAVVENTIDLDTGISITVDVAETSEYYLPVLPVEEEFVIEPVYGAAVTWYDSSSSILGTDGAIQRRGATSYEINNPDVQQTSYWKTFTALLTPPAGAAYAAVRIWVSEIAIGEGNRLSKQPAVNADNIVLMVFNPYIKKWFEAGEIEVDSPAHLQVGAPLVNQEIFSMDFYSACVVGAYTDTTGKASDVYPVEKYLRAGKESDAIIWQSWVPFTLDFSPLTTGIHIISGCFIGVASTSQAEVAEKICSINSGFENAINPAQPTDWATMEAKLMNSSSANVPIPVSWVSGETYEIDVTESAKKMLGDDAVYWGKTSGSWNNAAIMLKDGGSSPGSYREIASNEHAIYPGPIFRINYLPNSYTNKTRTTYIDEAAPDANFSDSTILSIGGSSASATRNNALLYFDMSSIPSSVTVTGASVLLCQLHTVSSGSGTLSIYPATGYWDWYGASWNKNFGTHEWTSAGGDYYSACAIATITASPLSGDTWVRIPVASGCVPYIQSLVENSSLNNGFLVNFEEEDWEIMHKYVSQRWDNKDVRPTMYVYTDSGSYVIRDDDETGDYSSGTSVTLENQVFISSSGTFNYTTLGAKDTDRYLLIMEGYSGTQFTRGIHFTSLTLGTIPMTQICSTNESDEANMNVWGVAIPNEDVPMQYLISGVRKNGSGTVNLYIREFSNVNATTPISASLIKREGANSTITISGNIPFVPKSYVADGVFLNNTERRLGFPQAGENQTVDEARYQYGFSHYTTIPVDTSGNVSTSWSWIRNNKVEFPSSGSDSVLSIICLSPK